MKNNIIDILDSGSNGNCYIIYNKDGKALALDLGVHKNSIIKSLDYNLDKLSHCLISHIHGDHTKSLNQMIALGVPCYGNSDVCDAFKGCMPLQKKLNKGGFKVQFFPVKHNVMNCAFVVDIEPFSRILYCTDTYCIPKRVKGVTTAIIECNNDKQIMEQNIIQSDFIRSHPENHMEISDCIEYLKEIKSDKLQTIVLCHLSSNNINKDIALERVKKELDFDNVIIAEKGVTIQL